MAITNAQQARQLYKKGKRVGFFSAGLAAGDDISPGTSTSGGSRNNSNNTSNNNIDYDYSYTGPGITDADAKRVLASNQNTLQQGLDNAEIYRANEVKRRKEEEKEDKARRKEEEKKARKETRDERKKETAAQKKTRRMQKAAFDRFQRLDKYVDPFGDETTFANMSGEEAAQLAGYNVNEFGPPGSIEFEYDKDRFRDPKTGKIRGDLTKKVNINEGKTDIFGRPKKPKFVEQFKPDAIPGYDFSINPVRNNFDGGLGTLTSTGSTTKVRPNDYGIQPKTGTSLDILSNFVRPEDGLQAFNTLEEARNVQDFAGRFQGGDDSAYEEFEDYITRNKVPTTGGGGGNQQQDPCLGPNPPAYCKVNNDDEEDATPKRNLGGLAPRFAGSIFDFTGLADGGRAGFKDGEGIMQTASAPDPMDERNSMMETIAMEEFGKPLSDLNEDEIIQIELFMEEMSKRKNESRVMAQQGGRMMMDDDPTGGIMDLESGRQMYFLGKLVKKVTRGVKKIVKSPVGKMALLGLGAGMAGFGPASGLFGSGKGLAFKQFLMGGKTLPPSMGFKSKGLLGSVLDYAKSNPYKTIGGLSLFSGLMTPKEEDDDSAYKKYVEDMRLDMSARDRPFDFLSAANQGSRFNVADGGIMRNGYAEGSEEPVAKKTMPLLDMDGQEMDLREEGGFVPLGRMERADDVPARLSKNEFVFTADAVRNAGEGDVDKGAEVMYNMMKNLESGGEVSEESQGLEGAREMFQTSQRLEEVI